MTAPIRTSDIEAQPIGETELRSHAPAQEELEASPARFLREHATAAIAGLGAVGLVAAVIFFLASGDDLPPPKRVQEFTIVNVTPPPPPPPPPPQPEQEVQPEPEMIEQTPIVEPEIKEEAKVEEPKDAPPEEASDAPPAEGPLGPGSDLPVGPGASPFAPGSGGGGGGGGGSRWGSYSVMVTREIEAAIRANPKTRNAVMQVRVRLWADGTGRITRVQLVSSSGDAEIDALLRGSALAGLQLSSAPPSDMPMPIVTRITARRSG